MLMEFILSEMFYNSTFWLSQSYISVSLSLALKYLSIFSIHVVKIMLSFFDQETQSKQLHSINYGNY